MKYLRNLKPNYKVLIVFFTILGISHNSRVFGIQSDYEQFEKTGIEEYKLIKIGRNVEAIKLLEKKIFNNNKNPYLYYLLGRAYGNLKQFEIGEDYFKKSLASYSNFPKVYLGYALLKGRKGQLKEAVKLLDKAIEIDPKYAKAYSNRGVARGALSDNIGAINDFNKAILIDPLLADAYRNRGITNELIGNIKGACKDWKTASSLGENQTRNWYSNQCNEIKEIKAEENQELVSSLVETNQRLNLELEALKNSSSQLREFSIGTLSENKMQKFNSDMNLKNIKDKKNQLLIIPSAEIEKSKQEIVESNQIMKIPSVEKEESKQEINNNLLISGPMKIDNIETPKSSLLTNSLTVENEFNSNTSNQNQVSILEANNLEDNSLIKQKNYLINLLFFVFGGFFFLIIPKFIKNKKDLLRKSSTKKGETNEKYLSQEFHSLNKLISQKTEHMNNLYLEKEIIENQIESIKYDLKYHEIQKTNLKVYTLTKYKELFPSQLDGIENMKFNGLVSNNINNTYSISKYNPYDMKSYKFIKNT
mgnify:CR=1 FL=1